MKISTCLHSQSQNEVIDMTGISDIQKDFSNHIKKLKLYPIMADEAIGSNDEVVAMLFIMLFLKKIYMRYFHNFLMSKE